MITPDGTVFFQRGWFHAKHVAGAIDEYYCLQEQQQQQQQPPEGQSEQQSDGGCLRSDGGSASDMGDGGSSPLAGTLPGGAASLPPWLR